MPLEEIVVEKETQEDFGIVLENEKYSVEGQRDVPAGLAQERLVETIAEHENVRERFKEERESWIAEGIRQIEEVREDLQDLSIIVPLELIEPTEHRIALYLEGRITEQQLLFRKRRQHKKIRGSKRQYEGGYADITEEQDLTPYRTEFGLLLFPPNIWRGMVDLLEENCTHGEILEQEARAMEEGYRKNPKIYQDVGSPFEQGDVSEKASTSDSLDYSHPEAREHQAAFVQDGVSKGWYRNVEEMYALLLEADEGKVQTERAVEECNEPAEKLQDVAGALREMTGYYEASLNGKYGDPENNARLMAVASQFLAPTALIEMPGKGSYTMEEAVLNTNGNQPLTPEEMQLVCAMARVNKLQGAVTGEQDRMLLLPLVKKAAALGIEVIYR